MFVRMMTLGLCLGVLLAGGCSHKKPAAAQKKVVVVASIFPLADAAAKVGGEYVTVQCLLPPGVSPHDYTPKPQQAEQIAQARLLVLVGMGIDEWAQRSFESAGASDVRVIQMARTLNLPQTPAVALVPAGATRPVTSPAAHDDHDQDEREAAGHHHHHDGGDPHMWLDASYMQTFVQVLAEELAQLDPAHKADFERNRDAYIAEIKKVDDEYRASVATFKHKKFVTFHAAFSYICSRYGLEQMALQDVEAEGFGSGQVERVATFVKQNNVRAIFTEPQFPRERLEELARTTSAKVGTLDPEGNPNVKGYDSYIGMMRSNLRALSQALKD